MAKQKRTTKINRLNDVRQAHKQILRSLRSLERVAVDDRKSMDLDIYFALLDMLYEYERLLVEDLMNPDVPF